jgi:hypothetical protein
MIWLGSEEREVIDVAGDKSSFEASIARARSAWKRASSSLSSSTERAVVVTGDWDGVIALQVIQRLEEPLRHEALTITLQYPPSHLWTCLRVQRKEWRWNDARTSGRKTQFAVAEPRDRGMARLSTK